MPDTATLHQLRSATPAPQRPRPTEDESLVNPWQLFHAARRQWRPILLIGGPLALLALAMVWKGYPAKYTAFAVLRLSANEPRLVFDTAEQRPDFETYRQSQVALLRSRLVIGFALQQPEVAALPIVRSQRLPEEWLQQALTIEMQDSPEFLRIALSGQEPEQLAYVVNAVAQSYLEKVVHAERQRRVERLHNLERIFSETDQKVRTKQGRIRQLAENLGTGDAKALTIKQQMALEYFAQIRREHADVRAALMREQVAQGATVDLEVAFTPDESNSIASLPVASETQNDHNSQLMSERIAELRSLIARYEQTVVDPNHPALIEYQQELKRLEDAMRQRLAELRRPPNTAAAEDRTVRQTLSRLELLTRQERALREEVERQAGLVDQIGSSSFELEAMRTELTQIATVADRLSQEIELLRIELQSPLRVAVVQDAVPPKSAEAGKKTKLALAAGLAVFGLVFCGFAGRDLLSQRISTTDEFVDRIGLPLLATLPSGRANEAAVRSAVDSLRAVLTKRNSESFSLLVSSAGQGEGRTRLAHSLAESFARSGRSTVLVDADLRNPMLPALCGQPVATGLSELLRHETNVEAVCRPLDQENLWLMSAGQVDAAAVQAMTAGAVADIVTALVSRFDVIVLDSSPLTEFAEPGVVGAHVDVVLLNVRRDHSRLPLVEQACRKLRQLDAPLAGSVWVS